jgi:hypothetical protein
MEHLGGGSAERFCTAFLQSVSERHFCDALMHVASTSRCLCTVLPTPAPLAQVDAGTPVALYAEGKEHAMAVGYAVMSTAEVGRVSMWRGLPGLPDGACMVLALWTGNTARASAVVELLLLLMYRKFPPSPPPNPQIREVNKGIGVENLHYLNDGLWKNNHID